MADLNYDTHVTEYSVVDFDCDGNYEIVASIQYAPEPYYYFSLFCTIMVRMFMDTFMVYDK